MGKIKEGKKSQVAPLEKEQAKALEKTGNDSSAKAAEKKEKQPSRPEDLSPIHNTHEIGTSGGDQRAKDSEEE